MAEQTNYARYGDSYRCECHRPEQGNIDNVDEAATGIGAVRSAAQGRQECGEAVIGGQSGGIAVPNHSGGRHTVGHSQSLSGKADVIVDGRWRQAEHPANLFRGISLRDQAQAFALPVAQAI